jgi:type I restriction enzyme S subunit
MGFDEGRHPNGWQYKPLFEICDTINYGYTQSASKDSIGPKFLRITDIQKDWIDWSSVPYCEISDSDKSKYLLHEGDIVIARTGASTGQNAYISKHPEAVFASYLVRLKINESRDPHFVSYFLRSQFYKDFIDGVIGGSAQPNASAKTLTQVELPLPPLPEQQKIASILSTLDDKIELNHQMNRTLEEMAQAIFKSWFVDFEFPNDEGEPYKSSGGAMVYNEELGKEIPEGWGVRDLKDHVNFERGIEPGSKNYFEWERNGMIPFLRVGDLSGKRTSNIFIERGNTKSKICNEEDILLSLDGTVGIVAIGYRGAYSTGIRKIVVMNENTINKEFVWCLLKTDYIQNIIKEHAAGRTTIAHAGKAIGFMRTILPDKEIMKHFHNLVKPLFDQIISNIKENQNLSTIRDNLLPKLLSGEIRVQVNNDSKVEDEE